MSEFYPSSESESEYEDYGPLPKFLITQVENKPGNFETLASVRDNIIKQVNVNHIVLCYPEGENRKVIEIIIRTNSETEAVRALIMLVNKCEKMFRNKRHKIVADDEHINPFPTTITTVRKLRAHPQPMHWVYISWDE
tara:strand:- start:2166 stop:2579 length:414 start_codon:yes stop_codon:yes gene_type:complete